jgi:hypothetical protein
MCLVFLCARVFLIFGRATATEEYKSPAFQSNELVKLSISQEVMLKFLTLLGA